MARHMRLVRVSVARYARSAGSSSRSSSSALGLVAAAEGLSALGDTVCTLDDCQAADAVAGEPGEGAVEGGSSSSGSVAWALFLLASHGAASRHFAPAVLHFLHTVQCASGGTLPAPTTQTSSPVALLPATLAAMNASAAARAHIALQAHGTLVLLAVCHGKQW